MALSFHLLTLCFLFGFLVCRLHATGCQNAPMDIVFVLDSSDGLRSPGFNYEKQFTLALFNLISSGNNQFGIITFGTKAHTLFELNSYVSNLDIQNAILNMWYSTGHGNVGDALAFTMKHAFQPDSGDITTFPNVIILLTHSAVMNETQVSEIKSQLQNKTTDLFVVMIGSGQGKDWFNRMTTSNRIFNSTNLASLSSVYQSLYSSVCKGRAVLQNWLPWSSCGKSCGSGIRRRFRLCEKRQETNEGCFEDLMQDERCNTKPCTDPVNGGWTYWDKWLSCSKTCGNGTQARHRYCTAPAPAYGGLQCQGSSSQTKGCASWSCPDCTKVCPPGGRLSAKCDICECSAVTLYGEVASSLMHPVSDADIYFQSRMYDSLTKTDTTGSFVVTGVCIMGETVVVKRSGYSTETNTPKEVNSTHWFIKATLKEYFSPVFTRHPESKARLVGQNVSLCCNATGYPPPINYVWYKGDTSLRSNGTTGKLSIQSLTLADSGTYTCTCETEAGITRSGMAQLVVKDGVNDSCGLPRSRYEELPEGCYVADDASKNSTFDIGTCGNDPCVTRDLHDNGTCSDWWPDFCCDAAEKESVGIVCDGFTYQTNRIKACKCQQCHVSTIISGKAFGRYDNGTIIPLRRGVIYIQGKQHSGTNIMGYFSFDVPGKLERITVRFVDSVYKTLLDVTKVITVTTGSVSSLSVVLPLRPIPVQFIAEAGLHLDVGGSHDLQPAGSVSIPSDSLLNNDGTPYNGSAKARVHFMDPRKLFDMEASDGEFSCEKDGETVPLETFGIIKAQVVDMNGNNLKVNKPLRIELDPSVFNVNATVDGGPNIDLWHFDDNKGIWVFDSRMRYSQSVSRRRLLNNMIVGDLSTPIEIPRINLIDEIHDTKQVFDHFHEYWRFNVDCQTWFFEKDPVYRDVDYIKETKSKKGACYVSVRVFKSFSLNEPDDGGTSVTAITKEFGGNKYMGFETKPTEKNGHVCLKIFCDSEVYIYAINKLDLTRLHALPTHDVPDWYNVTNIKKSTEIVLKSLNIEDYEENGQTRYSPVYYYDDYSMCKSDYEKNFNFHFGPLTKAPELHLTETGFDKRLSWYPYPPGDTRKTCYMKVRIQIKDNFDMRLVATSYQNRSNSVGQQYGTSIVGPIPDPTFSNLADRAACIEFRCPGLVNDNGVTLVGVPTLLDVHFNPPPNKTCRMSVNPRINVIPIDGGQKGFQFLAESGDNFGPFKGIYISNSDKDHVRNFCYNGKDTGRISNEMKPAVNPAVTFDFT